MRILSLGTVFMAATLTACSGAPDRHIEISSNTQIGNNQQTYFDCDTGQICQTKDTTIQFGRGGMTGARSKTCGLAPADEVERYQAICKRRYPDKAPD